MINIKEHESFDTEQEYRASPFFSYSVAKDMDFNPRVLVTPRKGRKTDFFDLGSVVDALLTDKNTFDTRYYISNFKRPSISHIIDEVYKRKLNFEDEKYKKKIIGIGREFDYQSRWKDDTLYNFLKKEGFAYFSELEKAQGKDIIDDDNYILALTMANAIQDKHDYLVTKIAHYEELIFQFKYAFKYQDVDFKIMLDIIKINHFKRTVTPIDIKTGSVPANQFVDNFIKFKYYYQGGLYTTGLQKLLNELNDKYGVSYTMENFKFIYVSRYSPNYPIVYNFTTPWFNRAHNGWKDLVRGRKVKGLVELANDYKWYHETTEYEASRDITDNYDVEVDLPEPPLTQLMANAYMYDM